MRHLISVALFLAGSISAHAQNVKPDLIGLGMSPELASVFGPELSTQTPVALAALGTVQGDAAPIVGKVSLVSGADINKGVILPATPVVGFRYTIINTAAATLKLYPGTGDTINATAANTAVVLAASVLTECVAASVSAWWCEEGVAP